MVTSIQPLVSNRSLQDIEDLCRKIVNREIPMPSADKDVYIDDFELEYGKDDRTNLQGLADALEGSGLSALQEAQDHLSLETFLGYWAVGIVVGQYDAYPYSNPGDDCHVYDDPESGVLHFVPHGMDEAFYYPSNDFMGVYGIVATRCKQVTECREALFERTDTVLTLTDEMQWLERFNAVRDLIQPYVEEDPRKPYSEYYIGYYQDAMEDFMSGRRAEIESQVEL